MNKFHGATLKSNFTEKLQQIHHDKTKKLQQDCSKNQMLKSQHFELATNLSRQLNFCCMKFIGNMQTNKQKIQFCQDERTINSLQVSRKFRFVISKTLQIYLKAVNLKRHITCIQLHTISVITYASIYSSGFLMHMYCQKVHTSF